MKCKICGFDIVEGQEVCEGCGTNIEELKKAGNIIIEIEDEEEAPKEEIKNEEELEPVQVEEEFIKEDNDVANDIKNEEIENNNISEKTDNNVEVSNTPEDLYAPISSETTSSVDVDNNVEVSTTSEDLYAPINSETTSSVDVDSNVEVSTTSEDLYAPINSEVTPSVDVNNDVEVSSTPETLDTPVENTEKAANVAENTNTTETTSNEKPKKKKKGLLTVIIIILVLLVIVGGLGAFIHFVYGSPKNVFTRSIDGIKTTLSSNQLKNDVTDIDAKISVKSNYMTTLNNLDFDIILQGDNKDAYLGLGIDYSGKKLNLEGVLKDKILYLTTSELKGKYIGFEQPEETTNTVNHTEEIGRIVNSIFTSVKSSIDEGEFTKTYEKYTIDNKEVMTAKSSLSLNSSEYKVLLKNILNNIKNDDQFIKDMVTITAKTEQDIKVSLDELIESLDTISTTLSIDIYTDLTTTKLYEINILISGNNDNKIVISKVKDNYKIALESKQTESVVSIVIDMDAKKIEYTVTANTGDNIIISMTYNINDRKELNLPDISNNILYEEITEEEKEEIMEQLSKNELIENIMDYITDYLNPNNKIPEIEEDITIEL